MKRIVVYQSSTGFTKKYAEWIAQDLKCKAYPINKVSKEMVESSDQIIFGGWIMANKIRGLDKIKKLSPKELVVFGVGATPKSKEFEQTIAHENALEETPFYYYQGGFHCEQLSFPVKLMLKAVIKEPLKSFDATNHNDIKPLLERMAVTYSN